MLRKQKTPVVSVTNHVLIPEHQKLSDKDKQELFATYHITLKDLPKILPTDPAIQPLSVKPGDVVKILRKSPTAGDAIFYRGVVHA
ncbi:MAG: DNA-directed RNA polymerase subunit H [Candidatus Woesearchaeota archaeon]|nr:DNA-directed RNA polymerase subunit H [Candidatus Woesearchaeota archaeon]